MAKTLAGNIFTLLWIFWSTSLVAVAAAAEEEDVCPAGIANCNNKDAAGAKLLQRRADIKRVVVSEQELIPRAPRPPRNKLFRIKALAHGGNVTGNVSFGTAHSLSENLLNREGLAGAALGENSTGNALDVINKNAEHMTPEEALRNGVLTTVDTIANLTGGNAEDADCTNGTNGTLCYQGDMVPVGNEQLEEFQMLAQLGVKKLNGQYAGNLWTGANVKYCFATDVSDDMKKLMETAFESIKRAVPCMTFTDVGNPNSYKGTDSSAVKACGQTPAIFIESAGGGCWSYIGMLTPAQLYYSGLGAGYLNMAEPGCSSLGTAIHEILHALGQAHEQSRPDRDMYLNIYWDNIAEGKEHNFDVSPKGHVGLDYDFLSIMQYSTHSFSANGQATLGPKDGVHDGEIGQRVGMSTSDAEQLASMYKDEKSSCAAATVGGEMGCTDTGSTDCDSLQTCGSGTSMADCCACGAGIEYQCWSGSACRQVDALPMDPVDDHADCIVDRTSYFPGYGCVIQNECGLKIRIKCSGNPGYYYDHTSGNGYYIAPFAQICSAKTECTFAEP